ncbi:GNAT family N-acetyltransferase [Kitasatospora sp. NPDC056138]|uniref:GNAT family N-acetyltransferase n=1 Tax=Kitasatospora sp. NPDC056138 TaxID=3345724 RepID=UPI0035D9D279
MTVVLSAAPTASAPALHLRPWRVEDAAVLAAAFRDPVLRRWLRTSIDGEAEARRWIDSQTEAWDSGTRLSFAVLERETDSLERGTAEGDGGHPVGHVVIKEIAPGKPSAEVGYWTSAEARGRGIAPRALEAVSLWALDPQRATPLERLELIHGADNHASCRVAEKSAFRHHSVLPAHPPAFPNEGHLHVRTSMRARTR